MREGLKWNIQNLKIFLNASIQNKSKTTNLNNEKWKAEKAEKWMNFFAVQDSARYTFAFHESTYTHPHFHTNT